jgi:hypothetical protein
VAIPQKIGSPVSRLSSHAGEARFVAIVTAALLVVTSLPYAYGYLSSPPDRWFGGVVLNVHDTAQYLSWAREAGTSLFTDNKLTAEPSARVFCNLHWWIPGRLAHILGLTFAQAYQLFRLTAIPLLTLTTYLFCAALFPDRQKRRFACLLALLTSGFGWVWVVVKYATSGAGPFFPFDVYTTPGNAFWVMVASPSLTLAAALTQGVLLLALLSVRRKRAAYTAGAAALALFLGLGHVYDLVTVWVVLALFGLLLALRDGWSWRVFRSLALVVLVSAPAALYWGWVSSGAHPVWQQALAQYDNLEAFTPDPAHLVILLGGTFLLALATYDGLVPLQAQTDGRMLLKCWFVSVPLLVYVPFRFQIMLLTAYNLPMALLAAAGLYDRVIPWINARLSGRPLRRLLTPERLQRLAVALLLLAVSVTNGYLLAWRLLDLSRHEYPFYLYRDEVAALRWLEEQTPPDEVVLSAFVIGHYVPGLSGDRAFVGSAVMTMDFGRKRQLVSAFFDDSTPDGERAALLREYGIAYVFYGPAEQALGDFDPGTSPLLVTAFSSPRVTLYRTSLQEARQEP